MSTKQETIDALTKSVKGLDGARRAGWAGKYEAEAKVDDALRDLNVARADLAIVGRFAGVLWGALESRDGKMAQAIRREWPSVPAILPLASVRQGVRIAAEVDDSETSQAKRRAESRKNESARRNAVKYGRESALDYYARRYGYANAAALLMHIEAGGS